MKLLVVTCLKEYQEEVAKIFHQAHVYVFSVTDIMGFKENDAVNMLDEWFASATSQFYAQSFSQAVDLCTQILLSQAFDLC